MVHYSTPLIWRVYFPSSLCMEAKMSFPPYLRSAILRFPFLSLPLNHVTQIRCPFNHWLKHKWATSGDDAVSWVPHEAARSGPSPLRPQSTQAEMKRLDALNAAQKILDWKVCFQAETVLVCIVLLKMVLQKEIGFLTSWCSKCNAKISLFVLQ